MRNDTTPPAEPVGSGVQGEELLRAEIRSVAADIAEWVEARGTPLHLRHVANAVMVRRLLPLLRTAPAETRVPDGWIVEAHIEDGRWEVAHFTTTEADTGRWLRAHPRFIEAGARIRPVYFGAPHTPEAT